MCLIRYTVVDPGFTKGGGGHKIMDLLSLQPHIYKITKTTKWEVVKNSASPKGRGHTLHEYSFSYWDTPTSGQKGGGGHLPEMSPPRSTYDIHTIIGKQYYFDSLSMNYNCTVEPRISAPQVSGRSDYPAHSLTSKGKGSHCLN